MKVTILGSALSGKGSFLTLLAKKFDSAVNIQTNSTALRKTLNLRNQNEIINGTILFETNSGSLWDAKKTISEMVSDADIIVFFFSTLSWCIDKKEAQAITKEDLSAQLSILENCYQITKKSGKSFNEIPWIFVLNKTDLDSREPFAKYLKEYGDFEIIKISVKENRGIDMLIERIEKSICYD